MGAAITMVLGKIVGLAAFIGKLAVAAFAAFWLLSTDLGCWLVEQLLTFAVEMISEIDVSEFQQATAAWGSLPGEVLNILGLLKAGWAASIIVTAIGIRLVLQLIPGTRLGS